MIDKNYLVEKDFLFQGEMLHTVIKQDYYKLYLIDVP